MVLIPTALVANGYGKHPAGLGRAVAVIASCASAPAAGASCWSSFASQLRGCQDTAVSDKTQAGFSEGAKDLAGGWEADSFSSCPQPAAKRLLSPSRVMNSQPVSKMFLSSLWCLAGLAHSEITGLVGLGRQGFGMQLDCTRGLAPQLCNAVAEAVGWVSHVPAAEQWCTGIVSLMHNKG